MINAYVIWPIVAALWSAFSYIGAPSADSVVPINDAQKNFIARYMQDKTILKAFKDDELRTWVSRDADELNRILKKEGFGIQLQPFLPQEFGVVSILDVMLEWLHEGKISSIASVQKNNEVKHYDAFELKKGFYVYQTAYNYPLVMIETKGSEGSLGKDRVWLTVADEALGEGKLWEKILTLRMLERKKNDEYTHAVIPMIDYDQHFRLDWLLNMRINGWMISQALQQIKFKMNEKGAHIKSAAAIAMMRSTWQPSPSKKLIIDRPFYLWVEREGVSLPIFAGYFDEAFWKKPTD